MKATAIANSNIAFVKYWGKKDILLNIPMNNSISMTLDENVSTKTTVEFSEKYKIDELILNNERQSGEKLLRVSNFLDLIRKKASINFKAKVVSVNNFPTAVGIASSASGFAALAAASTKALNLKLNEKELSALARQGSGSASRSIYGGFVEWKEEYAEQIKNETHWPELRDIIVVVSDKEKYMSSREAMKITVDTSALYKKRIQNINFTLFKIKRLIINKEFTMLMEAIMKESDNMHECMADSNPKIVYLNEESKEIKSIIRNINSKNIKAGYTFDAGPNAHIITQDTYVPEIIYALGKYKTNIIISKPGKGIQYTEAHLF